MKYLHIFETHKDLNGDLKFLRKEPKYVDFFKKLLLSDNFLKLSKVEEFYNDIRSHRNTIKQNNIDILSIETVEELDDMLTRVKLIEKFNKFTKLLPSYLRNEIRGNIEKGDEFRNAVMDFDYEEYKNIFLKKVNVYRNVDELLSGISNYIDGNNKSIRELVDEIESTDGIRVFYVNKDQLIAIVFGKKASCKFGSQQWCISGVSGNHWDSYVSNKLGVQYFIWNFKKSATNPLHHVGVTIYDNDSFSAHDKADKEINKLSSAIGTSSSKKLLNIDQLPKNYLKEYFMNNLRIISTHDGKSAKYRRLINSVVDDRFKRDMFFNKLKDIDLINMFDIFGEPNYLSDKDIVDIISTNPDLIKYIKLTKRLPNEFIFNFLLENPSKLNTISYKFSDKSFVDNIDDQYYLKLIFKYLTYLDNSGEGDYNLNYYNLVSSLKNIKKDKFEDPIFVKSLFDTDLSKSLRYFGNDILMVLPIRVINNMYRDNPSEWDSIINNFNYSDGNAIGKTDEFFNKLKNYFANKNTMLNFDTMDLLVFNARYERREVGVNPVNNKATFEDILVPERVITEHPLKILMVLHGMKLRAQSQGDLTTYGIWVNKGMFDEDGGMDINDMLDEDWFLDLLDSRKIKL